MKESTMKYACIFLVGTLHSLVGMELGALEMPIQRKPTEQQIERFIKEYCYTGDAVTTQHILKDLFPELVRYIDAWGLTPLHAVVIGFLNKVHVSSDIVRVLISLGADANQEYSLGRMKCTPIQLLEHYLLLYPHEFAGPFWQLKVANLKRAFNGQDDLPDNEQISQTHDFLAVNVVHSLEQTSSGHAKSVVTITYPPLDQFKLFAANYRADSAQQPRLKRTAHGSEDDTISKKQK